MELAMLYHFPVIMKPEYQDNNHIDIKHSVQTMMYKLILRLNIFTHKLVLSRLQQQSLNNNH